MAGEVWLKELEKQYSAYLGSVGSTDFVRQVHEDASICFDWHHFLHEGGRFETRHKDAFLRLQKSLQPILDNCSWPDPERFPYVERRWFKQEPKRTAVQLYHLVRRLQQEYPRRTDWSTVTGYTVAPVEIPGGREAAAMLRVFPPPVVSWLWSFLREKQQQIHVSADALRKVGFATAARGARKRAGTFRGRIFSQTSFLVFLDSFAGCSAESWSFSDPL